MDLVIVDTTVWIDYLRNTSTPQTEWLDRELPYRPFGLIDLTLCEVLQGISNPSVFEQVKRKLLAFHIIESGGEDIAIASSSQIPGAALKGHHGPQDDRLHHSHVLHRPRLRTPA